MLKAIRYLIPLVLFATLLSSFEWPVAMAAADLLRAGMPAFYIGEGADVAAVQDAAAVWTRLGWGKFKRAFSYSGAPVIFITVDQAFISAVPHNPHMQILAYAQPLANGCLVSLCSFEQTGELCEHDEVMIAHEIGHCLGFGHVEQSPHLMNPYRDHQAIDRRAYLRGLAR